MPEVRLPGILNILHIMELLRLDRRRRLLPVRIMCILFFEPVCSFYEIPAGVLRGTGHAMSPAVSTMVGTCVFRIVWICTVFRIYSSLAMLYHAFPLSWGLTIIFVMISFDVVKPFKGVAIQE